MRKLLKSLARKSLNLWTSLKNDKDTMGFVLVWSISIVIILFISCVDPANKLAWGIFIAVLLAAALGTFIHGINPRNR